MSRLRARWSASRRSAPPQGESNEFYPQQPTCQIPHLDYLLRKFLGSRESGFYVEVGAFDGLFASNTWGLAKRGWQGRLIEPVPHLADACRDNYRGLTNVEVIQQAIGASSQDITLRLAGTLTTANPDILREYAGINWARGSVTEDEVVVRSATLDETLIECGAFEGFDVLVVDVEGYEAEVFAGFSLRAWRPKCLIVELSDTHPDLSSTEQGDAELGQTITSSGYVIVYKDSINTVFIRQDVWDAAFGLADKGESS